LIKLLCKGFSFTTRIETTDEEALLLPADRVKVSHNFACWACENLFSYTRFEVIRKPTYP